MRVSEQMAAAFFLWLDQWLLFQRRVWLLGSPAMKGKVLAMQGITGAAGYTIGERETRKDKTKTNKKKREKYHFDAHRRSLATRLKRSSTPWPVLALVSKNGILSSVFDSSFASSSVTTRPGRSILLPATNTSAREA